MHREIPPICTSGRWVMLATWVTVALVLVRPTSAHATPTEPAPVEPDVVELDPVEPVEPDPVEPDPVEPDTTPTETDAQVDARSEAVAIDPAPPPVQRLPPPTPIEVDPANYRMVLAGDIVIGLGGAALIAMGVGFGIRSDAVTQRQALSVGNDPDLGAIARQDQRIRTGTITGITGGAAAGALFVTGITLVALGYDRERRRRVSLPTATVGPEGVGLGWSLRF